MIGYVINLVTKSLSIARKNFLNTVYGFYTVVTEAKTTLPFAQKLVSWASKHSMIFRHCGLTRPRRDLGWSAEVGGKESGNDVIGDSDTVSLQINIAGIM